MLLTFRTVLLYAGSRQKVSAGYDIVLFNSKREWVVMGGCRTLEKHSMSYFEEEKTVFKTQTHFSRIKCSPEKPQPLCKRGAPII